MSTILEESILCITNKVIGLAFPILLSHSCKILSPHHPVPARMTVRRVALRKERKYCVRIFILLPSEKNDSSIRLKNSGVLLAILHPRKRHHAQSDIKLK